jgi:hypothetical protein
VVLRVLLLDDLEFGEARGCYSCVLIFMDRCKTVSHAHSTIIRSPSPFLL